MKKADNVLTQIRSYPETTMFGAVKMAADSFPGDIAIDFKGKKTTYEKLIAKIEKAACGFMESGVKKGDRVTICMPNVPQAIIAFYALNRIGAVANMIHPLSCSKNITYFLNVSESKMVLTLDMFYEKVKASVEEANTAVTIIVARVEEELNLPLGILYKVAINRKNLKYPDRSCDILWCDLIKKDGDIKLPEIVYNKNDTAVILYSGGTSGVPKGIELTDFNFNALAVQIAEIAGDNLNNKCSFLSVMPIFHGFGLGIGIHTVLANGAKSILIPKFDKESYAKILLKTKPNFIAGVPTIYEALLSSDALIDEDLSFLWGAFCGGDSLSAELKARVDEFFRQHYAEIQVREGYGLTECVTASCVTPYSKHKNGSIGLPLRDTIYKIVEENTFNELPIGTAGEIIISGPTVMKGYLNNPEATNEVIRTDNRGRRWLFTGDMGCMDSEGFVYFKQRLKRMIITSGYNVYPVRVEDVIQKHNDVEYCCVIGVKDSYKMQKIRAYIVLKEGVKASEREKEKIIRYCGEYLDKFEIPSEIIFREELPLTLVGKVAYHTLEEEAESEIE